MKILCLHTNEIEYEATKKAIKEPEAIKDKKGSAKDCVVVFISAEKDDEENPKQVAEKLVHEVKEVAAKLGIKNVVLYPYVHLTSNPSNPATGLEILNLAKKNLKGFNVKTSPFGWYKKFKLDVKGHPLAELSRSFGPGKEKKGVEHKFELSKKKLTEQEKLNLTAAAVIGKAIKSLFPEAEVGSFDLNHDQAFIDIAGLKLKHQHLESIEKKANEQLKKLDIKKSDVKGKFQKQIAKDTGSKASDVNGLSLVPLHKDPFSKKLKALKALNLSSAYWRGSADNAQLVRVDCVGFSNEKDLEKFMRKLEQAEQRSHRLLGEQLELFTSHDLVGKGLPIWLPKGDTIRREVEKLALETEEKFEYVRVTTPILGKKELFETSGHLPYYKDSMYPAMKADDGEYYLKAMNCPAHHLVFRHKLRSYRDMPLRVAEYGLCHRNELSGTLTGLQRVRSMNMNDAHIYCRKDQIEQEVEAVLKLIKEEYAVFGFKDYWFRLSLSDLKSRDKYFDKPKSWKYTEDCLRRVLKKLKVPFTEGKDEAAFYGPKIDIQFKNVYGREDSMSTIQLDFIACERFGLNYVDEKGKKNNEVFVIHRAPLSTHERFMAFLIEHFAGNFPVWLNPVQVKVLSLTDRNKKYAKEVYENLKSLGVRVELDDRNETMGKKVREAQLEKVNYILTVGDQEQKNKTLAVRTREGKVKHNIKIDLFTKNILKEIKERSISS